MTYAFDPDLAAAVPLLPHADLTDPVTTRRAMDELYAQRSAPGRDDATDVRDVHVPGPPGAPEVHLRIFTPRGHRPGSTPALPAIYSIHGGGFVVGSVDMDDERNDDLAHGVGAVVIGVDYRLAPEHPFPAPLEDCYAGLVWLAENAEELGVDASRIAVYGISAGGGLAAGTALLARDRGGPAPAFQYLSVPEVDDRLQTPSMQAFTDTPLWSRSQAIISWDSYLGEGRRGGEDVSPYAAPARASDLTGLPSAYVSAMEFDPLRDESIAYALALLAAGTSVELHLFPGTFHGSGLVPTAEVSKREAAEGVAVLRKALRAQRAPTAGYRARSTS